MTLIKVTVNVNIKYVCTLKNSHIAHTQKKKKHFEKQHKNCKIQFQDSDFVRF